MIRSFSRYLIYILEICIFYSVSQIKSFSFFKFNPLWILPVFVCISLFSSKKESVCFGILCGFLMDLSSGGLFGIYAIILGSFGYLMSIVFLYFFKPNFMGALIFSFILLAIVLTFDFYINFCSHKYLFAESYISYYLKVAISTFVVSLPIYLLNKFILKFFIKVKVNE